MFTENYDHWFKGNKAFAFTEIGKAAAEAFQRCTQQNFEIIGDHFSRKSEQLKRFTHIRKPEEFMSLQKDCISEDLTAFAESWQKIIHTSMQNFEEFTKVFGHLRDNNNTGATSTKSNDRK